MGSCPIFCSVLGQSTPGQAPRDACLRENHIAQSSQPEIHSEHRTWAPNAHFARSVCSERMTMTVVSWSRPVSVNDQVSGLSSSDPRHAPRRCSRGRTLFLLFQVDKCSTSTLVLIGVLIRILSKWFGTKWLRTQPWHPQVQSCPMNHLLGRHRGHDGSRPVTRNYLLRVAN